MDNADEKQLEQVREAALRLLDFQDRTTSELTERLRKKGYGEQQIYSVIASLTESGLLDDARYARLFCETKLAAGKGSLWIRRKLSEKGISGELANKVLDELKYSEDAEPEVVRCLRKALSVCGLADRVELSEDGELLPLFEAPESESGCGRIGVYAGRENGREGVDYFSRKISPEETDRNVIRKEREKAKAALTRRLISAGFPPGAAFDAVRKIETLRLF